MPETVSGYLLARRPSTDPFEVWSLFTRESGRITLLHRTSSSRNRQRGEADLWDDLEIRWNRPRKSGSDAPKFVTEYQINQRHSALGQDWRTLELVSRLARMLESNLAEEEPRPDLFPLISQALNAWCEKSAPGEAILTKVLLRWTHMEGYGHPEDWTGATPASRKAWKHLRTQSVRETREETDDWHRALEELLRFLRSETAFELHT